MVYDAATFDLIKMQGTASHSFDSMKFIELENKKLLWGELGDQSRGVVIVEWDPENLNSVPKVVYTAKGGHVTSLDALEGNESREPAFTCGPYDSPTRNAVYDETAGGWIVT